MSQPSADSARGIVSTAFAWMQDFLYIALSVLLSVSAAALLIQGGIDLARAAVKGIDVRAIVTLLDRALVALMIVELLYTVQVSFREHMLVPEPFLLVALIATVRRILVITAEFGTEAMTDVSRFQQFMWELAMLTVLTLVLVASVVILRRRSGEVGAEAHHPPP